jgi:hypothetical protein
MRLSVTKVINDIMHARLVELFKEGAFPKVQYKEEVQANGFKWKSYSMFDFSFVWGTFAKVIDKKMKVSLDPELGVFTRKRSKAFLDEVTKLCAGVGELDVLMSDERFKTWMDDVMAVATAGAD